MGTDTFSISAAKISKMVTLPPVARGAPATHTEVLIKIMPDVVNVFGRVAGLWMRVADLLAVREGHLPAVGDRGASLVL